MKIEKGMLIRAKTTTKEDKFGDVLWEVGEVGLVSPEKDRKHLMDGVRLVMLGGTGPSARAGMTVIDSEMNIQAEMDKGTVSILPASQRDEAMSKIAPKGGKGGVGGEHRHGGAGVVEVD